MAFPDRGGAGGAGGVNAVPPSFRAGLIADDRASLAGMKQTTFVAATFLAPTGVV